MTVDAIKDIVAEIEFATVDVSNDPASGERCINIEALSFEISSFPALLPDVSHLDALKVFLLKHLANTMKYHGIGPKSVSYIAVHIIAADAKSESYQCFDRCDNEQKYTLAIALINNLYHEPSVCDTTGTCSLCKTPPKLVVCFSKKTWDEGVEARGLGQEEKNLVYMDALQAYYEARLMVASDSAYDRYSKITDLGERRARFLGYDTSASNVTKSPSYSGLKAKTLTSMHGPKECLERSSSPQSDAPLNKGPEHYIRGKKGKLLIGAGATSRDRDWSKAIAEPTGIEKNPNGSCLTCIQQGHRCIGDKLVEMQSRNSHVQMLKCSKCASHRRRYLWKNGKEGIDTYDKARVKVGGYVNFRNTAAGREARAKAKAAEMIARGEAIPGLTGQDMTEAVMAQMVQDVALYEGGDDTESEALNETAWVARSDLQACGSEDDDLDLQDQKEGP